MVTIDLRDKPEPARFGGLQGARTLLRPFPGDPAVRVLQRVLSGDILAAAVALVAADGLLFYDFQGWQLLPVLLWPLAMLQAGAYDR